MSQLVAGLLTNELQGWSYCGANLYKLSPDILWYPPPPGQAGKASSRSAVAYWWILICWASDSRAQCVWSGLGLPVHTATSGSVCSAIILLTLHQPHSPLKPYISLSGLLSQPVPVPTTEWQTKISSPSIHIKYLYVLHNNRQSGKSWNWCGWIDYFIFSGKQAALSLMIFLEAPIQFPPLFRLWLLKMNILSPARLG